MAVISLTNNAPSLQIVRVSACNECGYDEFRGAAKMFYAVQTGSFTLSLNPATDVVTVRLWEESPENQTFSTRSVDKTAPPDVIEIQLWSAAALLRTYKTDQSAYQISVSDLPKGMYFVRVIKDGKTRTQKLLKK